jgi:hypothetical protein
MSVGNVNARLWIWRRFFMREAVAMSVKVPPDVKKWLEREAARNLSSQASEIVRALRAKMEAENAVQQDGTYRAWRKSMESRFLNPEHNPEEQSK